MNIEIDKVINSVSRLEIILSKYNFTLNDSCKIMDIMKEILTENKRYQSEIDELKRFSKAYVVLKDLQHSQAKII
ncbi:hypothetical protein [Mucilaginibacter sp. 3215]|uniref:hypothetical protein n=1 Tax=Mucilaginibacter sp. 3215 TaxID=3373912 RepID=UPI003D19BB37